MTDNDIYYRQRIKDELAAANSASELEIAQIHQEMAQRYRALVADDAPTAEELGRSLTESGPVLA